jgi:hypothetical protein
MSTARADGVIDFDGSVDFDVHGLARVRLVDAAAREVAAVRRQLGPLQAEVTGEADLTIRFVDRLHLGTGLRLIGKDEAGFTDDGFLVLRSKHKARARVQLPLADVGTPCEIVCERGLPAVPFLIPILNLTILANGALPLHASAFEANATGVVTTGWSKGGKTEALLAFVSHGARYIGDEWVYVSGDGAHLYGIPEPIRVWHWHLQHLPTLRDRISASSRSRLGLLALAAALPDAVPAGTQSKAGRFLTRLGAAVEAQRHVDIAPEDLFGAPLGALAGDFDRLFLMVTAEDRHTTVEPIDPELVAERMAFSLQHERQDFIACYHRFRYAFPDTPNKFIEECHDIERALLQRVFAGKPAFTVEHPSPLPLDDLYQAMRPHC